MLLLQSILLLLLQLHDLLHGQTLLRLLLRRLRWRLRRLRRLALVHCSDNRGMLLCLLLLLMTLRTLLLLRLVLRLRLLLCLLCGQKLYLRTLPTLGEWIRLRNLTLVMQYHENSECRCGTAQFPT